MNERDAVTAILVGDASGTTTPSLGVCEPPNIVTLETGDGSERLAYVPVPARHSVKVQVRVRQGDRLRPLPYPLDDEDA
jgi:hypothetical protein